MIEVDKETKALRELLDLLISYFNEKDEKEKRKIKKKFWLMDKSGIECFPLDYLLSTKYFEETYNELIKNNPQTWLVFLDELSKSKISSKVNETSKYYSDLTFEYYKKIKDCSPFKNKLIVIKSSGFDPNISEFEIRCLFEKVQIESGGYATYETVLLGVYNY